MIKIASVLIAAILSDWLQSLLRLACHVHWLCFVAFEATCIWYPNLARDAMQACKRTGQVHRQTNGSHPAPDLILLLTWDLEKFRVSPLPQVSLAASSHFPRYHLKSFAAQMNTDTRITYFFTNSNSNHENTISPLYSSNY